MQTEIIKSKEVTGLSSSVVNHLVMKGDCSKMSEDECREYYLYRCKELGLDPAEKPFEFMVLQGKKILYALKSCTDGLCRERKLKREIISKERMDDIYVVVSRATEIETGRYDESTGAVSIGNLKGDALCNAIMKAETKSKRRAVLSLCGLGMLDETEIETITKESGTRSNHTAKNVERNAPVLRPGFEALEAEFKEADTRSNKEKLDQALAGDDIPDWLEPATPQPKKEEPALFIPVSWGQKVPGLSSLTDIPIDKMDIDQLNDAAVELQKLLKTLKSEDIKKWTTRLLGAIANRMDVNFNNSQETNNNENHN